MKKLRFLLLFLFLISSVVACGDEGEFDDFDDEDAPISANTDNNITQDSDTADPNAAFANYMQTMLDEHAIPGVAAAIVTSDETLFMQGFGLRDIAANLPVDENTLFHIGSTNKSMTALMIASLVDDGLLGWDTPVAEVYDQFSLADDEATQSITMRHLLSMRGGIPDWIEDDFDVDNATGDDVIPFVASTELLGMPGEEFSYSNISSSIGGYLGVIAASGDTVDVYTGYAQLLRERVLDPIGMSSSVVHVSDALDNPAYGKSYVLDGDTPVEADPEDYDGDPLAPSGTLKSSVRDMARYIQTHLNEGVGPDGNRVVSAENTKELQQPYLENYGMGWETSTIDGVTVIMHEGSYDNYLSVIGFMPEEEIGFVILSNSEAAAETLISDAAATIVDLYTE